MSIAFPPPDSRVLARRAEIIAGLRPLVPAECLIVTGYDLKVAKVFHAGCGNMHPMIMCNANDADEQRRAEAAGADILKLSFEVGGCVTGEHGVGIEKRDLMHHQFTDDDLHQQMRVQAVFDDGWLLNPAKVFPLDLRRGAP